MIRFLYLIDYKVFTDTFTSAPDGIFFTGKDGTFWSSSSSSEERVGIHNLICANLHTVHS